MTKMRNSCAVAVVLFCSAAAGALADTTSTSNAPSGQGPRIAHVPVLTVPRGVPVTIASEINSNKASVKEATLFIKLTELQKPLQYPMQNAGSNLWQSVIPAVVLLPVDHFWYYIEAKDTEGLFSDTAWQPVTIVTRLAQGGGAAGAASLWNGPAPWIVGGALLLGGAAVVADHNNSDGGGHDGTTPPPTNSPSTTHHGSKHKESGNSGNNNEEPCVETGSEEVFYNNLDPFGDNGRAPIEVVICGACPDASVKALASWGAGDAKSPYNNPNCSHSDSSVILYIEKPQSIPEGSETIVVFSNGHIIDQISWPPSD